MVECYIGIDLGTTNSAIAWGHTDSGRIKPEIIEISRQVDEIGQMREEILLPSCAYFPRPNSSIVGNHAKSMIQVEPGSVAKSMKCYMDPGSKVFKGPSGVTWTPIQIAAEILKYLKKGAEDIFEHSQEGFPKDDKLVIAVPASFNDNMRQATLKAAECAGFVGITDANLLFEPHAALYHFCNKTLPDPIDFSAEKKVLVFDLGGGTLDVSLHSVHQKNELIIKDIAVSDYTRFGGNNFDKLVAKVLLKDYLSKWASRPTLSCNQLKLLKLQFQEYAEEAKKQLSKQIQYESLIPYSSTDPCYEISGVPRLPTIGTSLPLFSYRLCLNEYKRIIKSFLAPTLTLDSSCSSGHNIITPILKVLDKGKEKLSCSKRPKVDIVLLNGGMTKLSLIKERLELLFGPRIVRPEADSDEAVALGAVVYQCRRR